MVFLNVLSLNVNGLHDRNKRQNLYRHFKDSHYDIICLQETHTDPGVVNHWQREWDTDRNFCSYWNSGTNRSCGVAILLKNASEYRVQDTVTDDSGRILLLHLTVDGIGVQIGSIYVPDRPHKRGFFFSSLTQLLRPTLLTILAGDYNMVEDIHMDRRGGNVSAYHSKGLSELLQLKEEFGLTDPWRRNNPRTREYTWKSSDGRIRSRLDRFYVSHTFARHYLWSETYPCVWSDHNFIALELRLDNQEKRGRGFWKLNTQVLTEKAYKVEIKRFLGHWKLRKGDYRDLIQWWEIGKSHIQNITQNYCTRRKQDQRRQLRHLKSLLDEENEAQPPSASRMQQLYLDIQHLRDLQHQGAVIRSRVQDVINGEKPTQYFYNQEKIKKERSIIRRVRTGETTYTTTRCETLNAIYEFYQRLYTQQQLDDDVQQDFFNQIHTTLPPDIADMLDAPITKQELRDTLTDMNRNRAPGIDGLPMEFLDTFWEEIGTDLQEISSLIFEHQQKPGFQQRLGVINLVHKTGEKEDLTKWRPITLLCADYKLLTKTMATRLRNSLKYIIHKDQTCSVPGRSIFDNLYILRDVINLAEIRQTPTYIISCDFEKAFDKVDHQFLYRTLKAFHFGDKFTNFIQTIHTDITASVCNNGYFTDEIDLRRGIRQGCPLSLPLYCLVAEVLATSVRANDKIHGFHLPGQSTQVKNVLYADDNTSITTDATSIDEVMATFNRFHIASGCHLNPDKTAGIILGHNWRPPETRADITWQNVTGIKILGIIFFADLLHIQTQNWKLLVAKLRKKIQLTKYRNLSLAGKRILINTTILARIWYLSSLMAPPKEELKVINKLIFDYLWDGRQPEPIRRATLYQSLAKGGVGIIKPAIQHQALRIHLLYEIVNPASTKTWVPYARYWISAVILKYHTGWGFLRNNNFPKYIGNDPPLYYKEFVNFIRDHHGAVLQLPRITTKGIYEILFTAHFRGEEVLAERYWNGVLGKQLPWDRQWAHNYQSYVPGRTQDILYKVMHNCLPTGERLQKGQKRARGKFDIKCKTCHRLETTLHIFTKCPHARKIWAHYSTVYATLQPGTPLTPEHIFLTTHLTQVGLSIHTKKLLLTLTTYILSELWDSRNRHKFENHPHDFVRSVTRISGNMCSIIKIWYNYCKKSDTLPFFTERFVNHAVCTVNAGRLILLLP